MYEKDGINDEDEIDDGRWIEAVCEYASTCDGCGDLTMHENLLMDVKTQLGYCPECVKKIKKNGEEMSFNFEKINEEE